MPALSLLIKPSSYYCNLQCTYCFYRHLAEERKAQTTFMTLDDMELLVEKALDFATGQCVFAFQGGEPTLIGLDFFESVTKMQRKYNKNRCVITNTIQTNGMLLDKEWASFLKRENFLVGLSIDGVKDFHDQFRPCADGQHSSYGASMTAAKLLQDFEVPFSVLCVVTNPLARHPKQVYESFRRASFQNMQFIPCITPTQTAQIFTLSNQRYASFLRGILDLWYRDFLQGNRIYIRLFDNLLDMLSGLPPEACDLCGRCSCQFVVESNLDVYPCDFYCSDAWRIGNIRTHSFEQMRFCQRAEEFIQRSAELHPDCKECQLLPLCRGGCMRHRVGVNAHTPDKYFFCEAMRDFVPYAVPKLYDILRRR